MSVPGKPGRLVHKDTGKAVNIGDKLELDMHDKITEYVVKGWRKPHKVSSSGRIFVESKSEDSFEQSLFPHVFGLEIVDYE